MSALLIGLAVAAAPSSSAPLSDDLYQATVIVTGTDMRSRPVGFAQALRKVLVKVSGEPRLHDDPRVSALAAHADASVASFSYVDRMAGRPVHDEQGTRDRPYNLTVKFVPVRIDKMLADLGQRPWRGTRPVIVPVLAVRIGTASYLLNAESPAGAEQRTAFADVARDFDMAVRFPTDGDFAAWRVIAGSFPSPHRQRPPRTMRVSRARFVSTSHCPAGSAPGGGAGPAPTTRGASRASALTRHFVTSAVACSESRPATALRTNRDSAAVRTCCSSDNPAGSSWQEAEMFDKIALISIPVKDQRVAKSFANVMAESRREEGLRK